MQKFLLVEIHFYLVVDGGTGEETKDGHAPGYFKDGTFVGAIVNVEYFPEVLFSIGRVEEDISV